MLLFAVDRWYNFVLAILAKYHVYMGFRLTRESVLSESRWRWRVSHRSEALPHINHVRCRFLLSLLAFVAAVGCGASADERQNIEPVYDETGKLQLLKYDSNGDGKVDTWSYMDGTRILRIEIDGNADGIIDRWEYYTAEQQIEKVGASRVADGKVDSWAYYAPNGQISRLERSTKRDGKVDRTEYYEKGLVARAEEDTNADGKVDKWEVYEGSRLASVAFDSRGVGSPDRRLVYAPDGTAHMEVADGPGRFVPAPEASTPAPR